MSVGTRRKYPHTLHEDDDTPSHWVYNTLLKELIARRRTDDGTTYAGRFQEKSR
jgi:hypothetical protein